MKIISCLLKFSLYYCGMETTKKKIKVENLMTVEEFAVFKGVTPRTVYNWIDDKIVKTELLFGKKLVDKTSYLKP